MDPHIINSENAQKIADWLSSRGGIFIWKSINLSDPDKQMISPANDSDGKPYTKPHWSLSNIPARHITDPADIVVSIDKEVKRFLVAVRQSSNGFSLKVTDGGTRLIRAEVEKAGPGAYHCFDYSDYNGMNEGIEKWKHLLRFHAPVNAFVNAVIFAPDKQVPLSQYLQGGN